MIDEATDGGSCDGRFAPRRFECNISIQTESGFEFVILRF